MPNNTHARALARSAAAALKGYRLDTAKHYPRLVRMIEAAPLSWGIRSIPVYQDKGIKCRLELYESSGRMVMRIHARGVAKHIGAVKLFPTHYEFVRLPGQLYPTQDMIPYIKGHRSMPFYDMFQILDPEYLNGHTLAVVKAKDTASAGYVDQRDYAIASAKDACTRLRTLWLRSCIGLALHDPVKKVGLLAHFDEGTMFYDSFQRMMHDLCSKYGVIPGGLNATLIGSSKCGSGMLLVNLFTHLQRVGVLSARMIMEPEYVCHAMLDVKTGDISLIDKVVEDPEFIADIDINHLTPLDRSYWNK